MDPTDDSADDTVDDTAKIAGEFPDWEAWQGIDRLWHARIRGAIPSIVVHGKDLVDLRDQIIRFLNCPDRGSR
jgi:hypothetical protein